MMDEMEAMAMDERQRMAWLEANRATLIAVGVTWVGMIGWELLHQQRPVFLIVMVPVFAGFRAIVYLYKQRVSRRP